MHISWLSAHPWSGRRSSILLLILLAVIAAGGATGSVDAAAADPVACADTIDNDLDGSIDFPADPGCVSASDDDEVDEPLAPPAQCSDGQDNDGDASIDFPADPGCVSASDDDEVDEPLAPAAAAAASPSRPAALMTPFPVVRLVGQILEKGARVTLLTVQAPDLSQIRILCSGPARSCPRASSTRVSTGSRVTFTPFQRVLRSQTVVRIFVTRRGFVGKYTRFTIRRGKAPMRTDKCARFGNLVVRCPQP